MRHTARKRSNRTHPLCNQCGKSQPYTLNLPHLAAITTSAIILTDHFQVRHTKIMTIAIVHSVYTPLITNT